MRFYVKALVVTSYRFSFITIRTTWLSSKLLCHPTTHFCLRCSIDAVPQHGKRLHEDLQPHLHDAADWTLVGLPPIPGADAARISAQLLGRHQRITGLM